MLASRMWPVGYAGEVVEGHARRASWVRGATAHAAFTHRAGCVYMTHKGFLMRGMFTCRDMVERRFKQKQWRQKRPPMLPFESYVLVEKAGKRTDAAAEPKAALQAPEQ